MKIGTRMIWGVAGLMVALGGCSQKGGALAPARPAGDLPAGTVGRSWPFAPASMRVHPLTRRSKDQSGRTTIEAHVELLDAWGHSTKGLGLLRFEFDAGGRTNTSEGGVNPGSGRLTWEIDISDPERGSRGYYDAVTRTYMVTLGLTGEGASLRAGTLSVTFVRGAGAALTGSIQIAASE